MSTYLVLTSWTSPPSTNHSGKHWVRRGAAIAQWICLCLPSCQPWFKSQAHHLSLSQFIFEFSCKKEAWIGPSIYKKQSLSLNRGQPDISLPEGNEYHQDYRERVRPRLMWRHPRRRRNRNVHFDVRKRRGRESTRSTLANWRQPERPLSTSGAS